MSVLWCGGEDIDFPNGAAITVNTSNTSFRSAYTRCAVAPASAAGVGKSVPFAGGAVSSCWASCRANWVATNQASRLAFGLGLSGTNKGIFVGSAAASNTKFALCKYDGTTITELATEGSSSIAAGSNVIRRIDIQIVGPTSSALVNVFIDGTLLISISATDISQSGTVTGFDSIFFNSPNSNLVYLSEIIVADEDLRAWPGLMTLALTGAGTTDSWTASTFSNINGTTISDASPMSSNTNAQDSQFNVTDLATGSFVIKAVKIAARAAKSASPAVTKIKLGYNDGGAVAFGGAAVAITTAYTTYEQLDSVNPNGGAAFTQSIMNALQLDAQSVT